jgi:hypothetical protein
LVNNRAAQPLAIERARFGEETPVARQVEEEILRLTEVAVQT